ncbi:hypothetical protein [Alteromonas phage XX1924]|nr:hypothetical protein [Alteromonas phage XX1924]
MINQQELAEAIETISEGGQAMGIHCDDVYESLRKNKDFMWWVMSSCHGGDDVSAEFAKVFDKECERMLKEALRDKQEVDSGCL